MSVKERKNAPLQKECGKCLRHPFLWIVCITFGLFQFLSIYTYVGNAGMRKELRQMHVAVTDEETASLSMKVPMRTIKRPMAECMIHWICVRFWNRKKKEWI